MAAPLLADTGFLPKGDTLFKTGAADDDPSRAPTYVLFSIFSMYPPRPVLPGRAGALFTTGDTDFAVAEAGRGGEDTDEDEDDPDRTSDFTTAVTTAGVTNVFPGRASR